MFTGLIEKVGKISAVKKFSGGLTFEISAEKLVSFSKPGDSIAVNGVCLTVTLISGGIFTVDAVAETLKKTTLTEFKTGTKVNLESALEMGQKLGGHIVQGHVNDTGKITAIKQHGQNYLVSVSIPTELEKYTASEGSIAIDGISLTIAQKKSNIITCSIIPHTWKNSNLCFKKIGDRVNIETDVLAKYFENSKENPIDRADTLTEERLIKMGY